MASEQIPPSGRRLRGTLGATRMAAVLTLIQILTAASAYAVNILSSRTLGAEGRGFLVLVLQLTYFAAIFVVLGIERPFLASVKMPFPDGMNAFVSFLKPGAIFSLAIFLGGAIVTLTASPMVGCATMILGAYIFLNGLGKGVRVAAISGGSPLPLVWFTLGTQGSMIVLAFLLAWLRVDDALVWFGCYSLTGLTSLVIFGVVRHRSTSTTLPASEKRLIRTQGLKLLPASIGNTAMVRSDRLILPVLAGISSLGIYSAVSTVMEMASWPIAQWVDASLGRWKRSGIGLDVRSLRRLAMKAVAVATLIATVVGIVAYLSIVWFLPDEFMESIPLIIPLGISSIIYAWSRVQQGGLVAINRGGTVSIIEISGMVSSVIGYFVFIPLLGAMGAAIGSIIGYSVNVIAGIVALRKVSRSSGLSSNE